MAQKPLQLVNGLKTEVEANTTSAGSGDAGKIVALGADGKLDSSLFPTGIGADVQIVDCTEDLDAGDFVNIYNSTGKKCRKADASAASAGKMAHGFVKNNYTNGDPATIYSRGANDVLTGLTPGTTMVLSDTTPGEAVALASAPTTAGRILQVLGEAVDTDTIEVDISDPIVRG